MSNRHPGKKARDAAAKAMPADSTPADDIDDVEVTHQPTLPTLELPDYHGRQPIGMRTKLTGTAGRITRAHTIGDRGVLVIEVKYKGAAHDETDKGLVYIETAAVLDMYELDGAPGSRLISTLRSQYRTGDDARKGRRPIPQLGDVGYTDSSGVALLPAELAELRGDPVRAILSPELTPAVVVFNDGERLLWPDEFPADLPRPRVGQVMEPEEGGSTVTVEKLLDAVTGENLPIAGAPPELPPAPEPGLGDEADPHGIARPDAALGDNETGPFDSDGQLGDDKADEWETPARTETTDQ